MGECMLTVETRIKIPFLWGKDVFCKKNWSQVNFIVGPNGTGKTFLSEGIAKAFKGRGYSVSFLRSERTISPNQAGQDVDAMPVDPLFLLQNNEKIRLKIEKILSSVFGKTIRFEKQGDAFIPIVVNKLRNVEYGLHQRECHGLKEIITLLVFLYSENSSCLIIDEPELHLHPQFQQFFMNEIRALSKQNPRCVFFLITHSPYFIDLRFAEDLLGVVVCHINSIPTYIDFLDTADKALIRRFLPRFNSYHKQFFFSDNQIFVEGYTDQQMLTYLLASFKNRENFAGTGIIDVGGKDELGVFLKVCSLLGTDCRIVTDLDSLFCGKLREVVFEDSRTALWLEKQREKQKAFFHSLFTMKKSGSAITLKMLVNRLEEYLIKVGECMSTLDVLGDKEIDEFAEKVHVLYNKYANPEGLDTFKTVVLIGIMRLKSRLADIFPVPLAKDLFTMINLANLIFAAFESVRVYILPNGCIEHYYTQSKVRYMPISAKDRLFHTELTHLIGASPARLQKEYPALVSILYRACLREV